MDALIIMIKNVLVFVALAVPAWILVKTKLLAPDQSTALSKILLYVGMPFLVFSNTMNVKFTGETAKWIVVTLALSLVISVVSYFLSVPVTSMEKDAKKRGMMRFCITSSNSGFLGIPLTVAVFGADSLVTTYLIAVNIVTNTVMYTLGAYLVSQDKRTVSVTKSVINPVLLAFVAGLICSLLKVPERVPMVATYGTHFTNVVTPLSMSVIGMKLGGAKFSTLFKGWKTYYTSALKLLGLPLITTAICLALYFLGWLPAEVVLAMFMFAAMPTASLASTFADNYGGDTEGAVSNTLASTAFSVATIPLLYWVLCALL